jgi:hypothetical protein
MAMGRAMGSLDIQMTAIRNVGFFRNRFNTSMPEFILELLFKM